MKRASPRDPTLWPHVRRGTVKEIDAEICRARRKHPTKDRNLPILEHFVDQLKSELNMYQLGHCNAQTVYMTGITVAAMAIRVLEEGSGGFAYVDYRRDNGPLFNHETSEIEQ